MKLKKAVEETPVKAYKIVSKGVPYYLHVRQAYYFAKKAGKQACAAKPEGFKVKKSPTSGLPFMERV